MDIKDIDKIPTSKEKLRLLIDYGKRYNCLYSMPEIHDMYLTLKKEGELDMNDWNTYLNNISI